VTDYAKLDAEYEQQREARDLIVDCGLCALPVGADSLAAEACLRRLQASMNGTDPLGRRTLRNRAIAELKRAQVADAAGMVDAALCPSQEIAGGAAPDVAPADEPQELAALLTDIVRWITTYVFMTPAAADAATAWVIATWAVEYVLFAPLLVLVSATKRAGKTTLLDLLRHIVRCPHLTSAFGATGAVIFRLNEVRRPTFLLDEAERLGGHDADRDVVNLLNQGYRRGAKVSRCVKTASGGIDVQDFDAFGFRGLALIGRPWDTLADRGILVPLERKPRDANVARWSSRTVEREGSALARRIARWAQDHAAELANAEAAAPRFAWHDDRAADNWGSLFGLAALAGGEWPHRLAAAARALRPDAEDDADRGERLVRDVGRIFAARATPEVIKSGELVAALNEIEEAPWADDRGGRGLSTSRVSGLFRPFGVRPRQARCATGEVIRGYWWENVAPIVDRYDPSNTAATGTPGTPVQPEPPPCTTVPPVPISGGCEEGRERDPDEEERRAQREGA